VTQETRDDESQGEYLLLATTESTAEDVICFWFILFFFLPVCFCLALLTRLLSLKKGHNPTYSIKLLVQSVVAVPRHRSLGSLSCN
jgi:hypothetical protein